MAQQKLPFRYSTRQRTRSLGEFPVDFGDSISIELPRVGFLAGLHITLSGAISRTNAVPDTGTFTARLFNAVQRFSLNLNLGASSIDSVSGFGLYTHNRSEKYNYGPDEGGPATAGTFGNPNASLAQDTHVFRAYDTVPETNAPFLLTWWLPVSANNGRNFNMGLINLQAPEVRATLDIQMASAFASLFQASSVLTNTTHSQLSIQVHMLFYEVPNPSRVLYPPLMVHRILEERQSFQNTGDIVYTVPRQGTLLRLHHNLVVNGQNDGAPVAPTVGGVPATHWMRFATLRVNKTDDIYREFITYNRWKMRYMYGQQMPEGTYGWELWSAEEAPGSGDFRDAIDSEAISTLESIITIADNAVLGQGNNFLDSIREIVQVLQV